MILIAVLFCQIDADPGKTGPHGIVAETRHYRDEQRNRPLRTEIWRPAPSDEMPVRLPVVLFSHGLAGTRLQSTFICRHLASHGYLVAAVDHAGNTFLDLKVFGVNQSARDRPHDLRVVFDKLIQEARDPQSTLFGRVEARGASVGHSFGGYTALATAGAWLDLRDRKKRGEAKADDPDYIDFDDSRIVAAVAMAPVMRPFLTPVSLQPLRKPVLILAAERDSQVSPKMHQTPLFESLFGLRYLGIVEGATHFSFMDQAFIDASPMIVRAMHRPRIDREKADELILRQTTAFLERHLRGSPRFDRWLSALEKLTWRVAVGSDAGRP